MTTLPLCRSIIIKKSWFIEKRAICTYIHPRQISTQDVFQQQCGMSITTRYYYNTSTTRMMTSIATVNMQHQHNQQKDDNDNNTTTSSLSARKLFQQIPIHPSILEYIRTIGVGIVPRDTSGRRNRLRRKRFLRNNHNNNDEYDTEDHYPPVRRNQNKRDETSSNDRTTTTNKSNDILWMPPPPPFGPKALHVQLIGSVGPKDIALKATTSTTSEETSSNDDTATTTVPTTIDMKKIFPKNQSCIPEIAIIGRSNVGKSTLLNALLYGNRDPECVVRVQHKQHGRVPNNMKLPKGIKATMSDKPGETKCISFYKLQHIDNVVSSSSSSEQESNSTQQQQQQQSRSLLMVDLPGYGFAYAKEQDTILYQTLIRTYLLHRPTNRLKRVLLLIDARHGMKKADIDFITMLEEQHIHNVEQQKQQQHEDGIVTTRKSYTLPFSIQIVLTKCDLVLQTDLARRVTLVRQQLSDILRREPIKPLPIMLVSARAGVGYNNVDPRKHITRGGIYELQKELATLAQPQIIKSKSTVQQKQSTSAK